MDWSILLDYLLKIMGSALAGVIITLASILFAKLKAKINDTRVTNYINQLVQSAEQLYPNLGTKTGEIKYQYVLDLVLKKFPKLENNEHLKALIEGAVYTLSEQINQIAKAQKETTSVTTSNSNTPIVQSF